MQMLLDILSGALLAGGSFFILVGAIGLVRLPDVFARMHGAGVTDTLGEVTVIFTAGVGVLVLLTRLRLGRRKEDEDTT